MSKILFVDDEIAILEITKLLLNSLGFEAILVSSGQKTIEILSNKEEMEQIKIIFLDMTMPEVSGIDVLKWMNKNNIKIPTILQTGIESKNKIKEAKMLGIRDCLIKPYRKEQLNQLILKYALK